MAERSSSYQRVNLVTEAQCVLPSITSAFSLEGVGLEPDPGPKLVPKHWLQRTKLLDDSTSSSCRGALDHVDIHDDPAYTDTVRSNDSANSLLRRSLSLPPEYTYSTARRHAREVFQDFMQHGRSVQQSSRIKHIDPPDTDSEYEHVDGEENDHNNLVRRETMADLLEKPDYIDSLDSAGSGTALLARTAAEIAKGELVTIDEYLPGEADPPHKQQILYDESAQEHHQYVRNLMILSVSFMLVFTAYMSIRNLQTSLNHDGGLGLMSLSSVYGFLLIGCVFATTIVQRLRPKWTMVLSMGSVLLYTGANFYPSYYTLLPASCLTGFCLASLWTAHATYLTNIAVRYSELTGKKLQNVLSKFNGIFFMFFQVAQIIGGIISSTVLMSQPVHHDKSEMERSEMTGWNKSTYLLQEMTNKTTSQRICGAGFVHTTDADHFSVDVSPHIVYILVGVFTGCAVCGLVIIAIFLDKLEGVMKKSHDSMKEQMLSVFHFFYSDPKPLCLLALMFYSLLQVSFLFGEFNTAFVTCAIGVHMVGYVMLCFSACSCVSAYMNGKLQKYIGRLPLFCTAAIIQFALLVLLLLWLPTVETVLIFFLVAGAWGIADGIWLTQIISMFGVLFAKKEPAFAGLKMCQALGVTIAFSLSRYISTYVKIYSIGALLVVAMAGYLALEITLKRQTDKEKPKFVGPTRV